MNNNGQIIQLPRPKNEREINIASQPSSGRFAWLSSLSLSASRFFIVCRTEKIKLFF